MLKKLNTILNVLMILLVIKDIYDVIKDYNSKSKVPVKEVKTEKVDKTNFWKNRKYIRIR